MTTSLAQAVANGVFVAGILLPACVQPPPNTVEASQVLRAPDSTARRERALAGAMPEFKPSSAGFQLPGRPGEMWFDAEGARLSASVAVRTLGWGRPDRVDELGAHSPRVEDGTLLYSAGGLTEWWRPGPRGVEQGWTIAAAPAGPGPLTLEVGVGGQVATTDDGLLLSSGGERWRVSGLFAWDADGNLLGSRFVPSSVGFQVQVDDAGARYPIDIDPVYRYEDDYHDTSAYGFGTAMDGGGDVNGDGYSDVIIASEGEDDGRAWVYTGSAEGRLTLLVTLTDLDFQSQGRAAVAFADVNGDGYSDVVAGADAYDEALVFLGPELALTTRLQSTCRSPFGYVVANAGDTNADGYDDVIVGSPEWDDSGYGSGCVGVYLGSSGGLSGSPSLELRGEDSRHDMQFGDVLAGLGDVNGDGFDEIGIGSYEMGYTYVYAGSAAGPAAILSTVYLSSAVGLDGAGDVNADGFADVVAINGTYGAEVFMGSAEGLGEPSMLAVGYEGLAGAHDVGGDGYDDILVGIDGLTYLFSGAPSGVGVDPTATLECGGWTGSQVAAAGDVDGDGLDDVLTGAAGNGVCLFLGSTLAGPGETGVIETGAPSWPHPDTSPDTSESDDSPAGTDSDDTEEPGRSGKSGCAGGGCGGGSVSAVVVLLGLSGVRRRRTATPERRRKRRGAADS